MKCSSCGANIDSEATTCDYCNSTVSNKSDQDHETIFAQLKASDEFSKCQSAERLARLPNIGNLQKAITLGFFIIFTGVSAFMVVGALAMAGVVGGFGMHQFGGRGAGIAIAPLFFAIVPMGFVVVGVLMFLHMKKKMDKFESDPTQALPVIVIDKRTEVWGGSGDNSAKTNYHITCEAEDGTRQEYQVWDGQLYGRVAAGDAGILFAQATYGLDFDRVATLR